MQAIQLPIGTDDLVHPILGPVLTAGKLVVTMRSNLTGRHITIAFHAKAKVAGRWRNQPYALASHVFIDVPNSGDDGFNDKVGVLYPTHSEMRSAGMFWPDRVADPARSWAALQTLRVCIGEAEMETSSYTILPSTYCLRCGRELTEPESVAAGMGPKCGRIVSEEYGKRHQVKQRRLAGEVERGERPNPGVEVQEPIKASIGEPEAIHTTQSTGKLSDLLP